MVVLPRVSLGQLRQCLMSCRARGAKNTVPLAARGAHSEGGGAHLWDRHDNLQRPGRPPSRQSESLGCRPEVPAKHRQTTNLALEAVVAVGSRVGGMETVVVHAADAAEPCSAAHELQYSSAALKSAPQKP